jgi:hypothetical protein
MARSAGLVSYSYGNFPHPTHNLNQIVTEPILVQSFGSTIYNSIITRLGITSLYNTNNYIPKIESLYKKCFSEEEIFSKCIQENKLDCVQNKNEY